MTYPPQQPGQPNPYGQQPGQYGQQQPGQYGQYGQQPGQYPQQPNPYGGPPKKSRTGLIVTIVVIAVLVLGGGGVAVYLLNKDDTPSGSANQSQTSEPTGGNDTPTGETPTGGGDADPSGAVEVANKYVDAINNQDESAAKGLTCSGDTPGVLYTNMAGKVKVKLSDAEPRNAGDNLVYVSFRIDDPNATTDLPQPIRFQDEKWCLSG